ncbi:hypothetical protein [Aquimarina spongiae]|uniref:META domain-containing protein n=1 Tax=Aquimarina spongiae TaxID=570521 RepID=A0A1M6DW76_9FLAO|nr:hypothetical protein [Aquimarina spongiae]SHI77452.1 hypothetical protein SAMN04488508_10350 [Aquimarina spongiae]
MKSYAPVKVFVLIVTLVFIIGSCSKDDGETSYDLSGDWKVAYYIENGRKITKADKNTWPDSNNGDITASFSKPDIEGKGTISGITVTNSYQGEYTIDGIGKITIGSVYSTLINEPEWTQLYNIIAVQSFEIRNSELLMYYNDGEIIIVFERN